jgi:hypothetical protein
MTTARVRAGMLYAWRGPSLLIVGDDGHAGPDGPLYGFYHSETRFLSTLRLTINGREPWLCECAEIAPDLLAFNYVYPEITTPGGGGTGQSDVEPHVDADGVPERALDIRAAYDVHPGFLDVRFTIANRSTREVRARLELALDADFADIQEAQARHRDQQAAVSRASLTDRIRFTYAHPDLPCTCDVMLADGWRAEASSARVDVVLPRAAQRQLSLQVRPQLPEGALRDDDSAAREAAQDTVRRILDWAREHGDRDRDGYLEYLTRSSKGTKNQGWKDSGDAIVYDDGSPVPSPIATCEIQGYWYAAQQLMAMLCVAMHDTDGAVAYRRSAADLKARFNRDWWVTDEQCFALALDPEKRQVRAVTSNVGHCLAAGIIDRDHIPPVVDRLFAPDLFSGWGIRTLSSAHAFYDPLSYHRGTVWAVEQGTIVFGLHRFGFDARAIDLAQGLFDLAELYPDFRIPECVGGYSRDERSVPGAYPRANTPQLWNASAFPLVMQTLLGLLPIAPAATLIVDPVLPAWLPDVVVRGLRVGDAEVTLRFVRRANGHADWDVLHKRGTLHVVRQPPPESLTAGLGDRAAALLESLL